MKKLGLLLIIIFFVSFSVFSQSQTFTTKEGDKFQIEFKAEKESVMIGEPAMLSLELKNLSEYEMRTRITSSVINGNLVPACKLNIIDSYGKLVPTTNVNGDNLDNLTTKTKSISNRKYMLSNWFDIRESGTYTINFTLTFYAVRSSVRYSTLFQADFTSTITVTQPDYAKMGEVIDSIGKTMLNEKSFSGERENDASNALKMLVKINDERIIPYLVQALNSAASIPEIPSRDQPNSLFIWVGKRDIYSQTALFLAKSDDYTAMEALENALNTQNSTVKDKVASNILSSKNLRAVKLLVEFRNDKNSMMRLRAVDALKQINTEDSTLMLREMLKDENQFVKTRAQEIITQREQK